MVVVVAMVMAIMMVIVEVMMLLVFAEMPVCMVMVRVVSRK